MTCRELEQFLYPYLDDEFGPAERLDMERHLAECSECARKVHLEGRFRETLKVKANEAVQAAAVQAPASLRQGVLSGLRREQRQAQRAYWMKVSAAALVVAVAGGSWWHLRPPVRQRFLEDATRWHAKGLPLESRPGTHEQAEAWFIGKLDHHVHVPSFPTATMDGVRLLQVKDKPAAYISYEAADSSGAPGRKVGLFVFDDTQGELEVSDSPSVVSNAGFQVAIWREGEIIYEMVSDLDQEDILRLWKERSAHVPPPTRPAPQPVTASPVVSFPPSRLPSLDGVRPASLNGR